MIREGYKMKCRQTKTLFKLHSEYKSHLINPLAELLIVSTTFSSLSKLKIHSLLEEKILLKLVAQFFQFSTQDII